MYTTTIKYEDFNGEEQEEVINCFMSKPELIELELNTQGGMEGLIKKIIETNDNAELIRLIKKFIHMSYGEKSVDGKSFIKIDFETGRPLIERFSQTMAYSEFYMMLANDDEEAARFIEAILPKDLREAVEKEAQKRKNGDNVIAMIPDKKEESKNDESNK